MLPGPDLPNAQPFRDQAANAAVARAGVDAARRAVRRATSAAFDRSLVGDVYAELLHLQHAIGRASVPLLRTAEDEATRRAAAGDAVAQGLIDFVHRRAAADLHRDDWLLEDFAVLDRDPVEVVHRPPPPSVAAMAGAIYYWILHFHPVTVLGHVAVLDGTPPSPALVAELPRRTGHPESAFRTIAHDARMSSARNDELWVLLDRLPLPLGLLDLVVIVACHTADRYVAALGDLTGLRDP